MTQLHITAAAATGPLGSTLDDIWNRVMSGEVHAEELEVASGKSYVCSPSFSGSTANTHTYGLAYHNALIRLLNDLQLEAPVDAVFLGTAVGNLGSAEERIYTKQAVDLLSLDFANLRTVLHGCEAVDEHTRFITVPTGCCAGLQAAGLAKEIMPKLGLKTAVVASLDFGLTPLAFEAFAKINATTDGDVQPDRHPSRPFCKDRSGFLFADGGGAIAVTLEQPEQPVPRITGYGCVSSAFHMTDIAVDGMAIHASIEGAMKDASVAATDIGHVNLHASGTVQNDQAEHAALSMIFGNELPSITAFKGNHGHALSGANLLEIALSWKMMQTGQIPPTPKTLPVDAYENVPPRTEPVPLMNCALLKTASGFSGIHASLVMEN
ncbi:MAG: beta-ketoacyl synthase N-terminal-like domain-containing protein [Reinekea sp.]|nr:beta-ketoacyl synthase N-terminal-like domain-containing protein [Reinekea sp.]